MKKSLLFVIDSLNVAGAEKSLVTLLTMIDYKRYTVDLILFAHGGELEKLLPAEVNVLKPLNYISFSKYSLSKEIFFSLCKLDFQMLRSRIKYSTEIRRQKYTNPQKARVYWECVSQVIEENPKTYDVAISYAQGVPTFYVAEKVKAKRKYVWVNVSYKLDEKDRNFQRNFYDQFQKIVAVSDSTKEIFLNTFPYYSNKVQVIYDINNPQFISEMAQIGKSYDDPFDGIRILTVGRLSYQKGYDIALEACKKLKSLGIQFKWYALGKGPLQKQIEKKIRESGLTEHFILLGVKTNPYPYIKNADMYVQTSRFEGFGLAIAEARMLNTPVVTTRFDAVYNQMKDGKNGLVVDMDAEAVCEGIFKMINDQSLREQIIKNLQAEKKGNIEEINKFYDLIEDEKVKAI